MLTYFISFLQLLSINFAFATTDVPNDQLMTSTAFTPSNTSSVQIEPSGMPNASDSDTHQEVPRGDAKIPLYLGGFTTAGGLWISNGIVPSVELAFDQINARSDILPDYVIKVIWNDTQVSS